MTQATTIKEADLIESVAAALQYISYYHTADYISHLARAYDREQAPRSERRDGANLDEQLHECHG